MLLECLVASGGLLVEEIENQSGVRLSPGGLPVADIMFSRFFECDC